MISLYKKYLFTFSFFFLLGQLTFASDIHNYDIVIVGGGLSGLNSARTIHKACPDTKIAIIEGRDRLGGRTHTLTMPDLKTFEAGGEIIERDEKFIQGVLKELGIEKEAIKLDGDIVGIDQNKKIALDQLVPQLSSLINKLNTVQGKLTDSDYVNFDSNLAQWVYTDLSSRLDLNDVESFLLQAIIRDDYGIDMNKMPLVTINSIISMLEEYKSIAKAKSTPVVSLFASIALQIYDAKYRIKGGTQALVQALAKEIPQESIFLNTSVTSLSRQGTQYRLQTKSGRTFSAKKVILSTPFSVLRSQYNILDDASLGITAGLRQVIDTMTYGTNSKLIVPAEKLTPISYALNMIQGGVTAWQRTAGMTWMIGGTPGALIVDGSEIVSALTEATSSVMNGKLTAGTKPIVINWSQDPFSRGSYSVKSTSTLQLNSYNQGSVLPELYDFATPLNNNTLFFIGEHTCCGNGENSIPSGHMQSALFSGHVVGKYISSLLKE